MPLTQRINRQHTRMARVPPTAAVAVAIVLTLMGCNERFDEVPETFLDEPAWLASTQAPTLESREDVLTLWQSEKRCCDDDQALFDNAKVLYKACYMAIANDSGNRKMDLHANMAWYYQKSSFDKEDLAALQQAYTDLEPQPQSSRGVHQTYARFGKAIERLRESAPGNH